MSDPKFVDENRDPKSMTGEDDKDVEALARPYPVGTNEELDDVSVQKGDLLGQEHTDPVLNAKMHLVNDAIDEIGFTGYHWKLFVLNGFG